MFLGVKCLLVLVACYMLPACFLPLSPSPASQTVLHYVTCRWALPGEEHTAIATRLAEKYLEDGARQLIQLCSSSSSRAGPSATATAAAGSNAADQVDALAFKTQCRGLLASMAAVVIGLMSRLRDFEGFVAPSAADEAAAAAAAAAAGSTSGSTNDADLAAAAANILQVVGGCASPIGRPGVRNCAAAALTIAIRHLQGGDRELLEQASYTSLLLMSPGMLEQAVGGQGRSGGKDDGAITDEPAAATAYLMAWGSGGIAGSEGGIPSSAGVLGANASTAAAAAGDDGESFVGALMKEEVRVHEEAAAARAAAAAGTADALQPGQPSSSSSVRPAAGSWGSEWRWRRRSSPMSVIDRLRRMLLWRCAQAAAKAAPPASSECKPVLPSEAAAGSASPAGAVRLQQLPQEYLELFLELLSLSMQPNAGVRGSAVPTLLACVKRFPCLVELLVPEVLAALAGVTGPVLGAAAAAAAGKAVGLGGSSLPAAAAAGGGGGSGGKAVQLPQAEDLQRFYTVVLQDAMRSQQADTSAAAAAGGGSSSEDAAGAQAVPAAAAAMLAAAAKAAGGNGNGNGSAAAAAKAAAAAALAAAGAGRSVAQESVNDGRVAGACTVLTGCLDAWRVIFRDRLVFRGFLYALMASRCHSSNTCLKSIQMLIMQVS
jgi:hypothetical protein